VAGLGEGSGGPPPLFWVKKKEIGEGRKAGKQKKKPYPPPVAQGLDPTLINMMSLNQNA